MTARKEKCQSRSPGASPMTNFARCLAALACQLGFLGIAATAVAAEPEKKVDLSWAVKIPMRDGVKLNATVYRPHAQKEPLPVIFELTPYISDNYHGRAYYFAQHGYVFALV